MTEDLRGKEEIIRHAARIHNKEAARRNRVSFYRILAALSLLLVIGTWTAFLILQSQ